MLTKKIIGKEKKLSAFLKMIRWIKQKFWLQIVFGTISLFSNDSLTCNTYILQAI